jgi:hypothetical protein
VYDIGDLAVTRHGEFSHAVETVVEVILKIDNPHENAEHTERGELRSGNSARADIKTGESELIYTVPYSVIMQDEVGEFVFVLDGHSVMRRDILTGVELAEGAQVLSGLTERDLIVAAPESVRENELAAADSNEHEDDDGGERGVEVGRAGVEA